MLPLFAVYQTHAAHPTELGAVPVAEEREPKAGGGSRKASRGKQAGATELLGVTLPELWRVNREAWRSAGKRDGRRPKGAEAARAEAKASAPMQGEKAAEISQRLSKDEQRRRRSPG